MSFIHLDDAAAATVLALDHGGARHLQHRRRRPRAHARVAAGPRGGPGREAAAPRPALAARLVAGEAAVMLGTESRGASNAKARRELGWELRYPSWRQGFVAAYAPTEQAPSVRLREVA